MYVGFYIYMFLVVRHAHAINAQHANVGPAVEVERSI